MSYEEYERLFREADPTGKFQTWNESQLKAFEHWDKTLDGRMFVFYPTGLGKTKICLSAVRHDGWDEVIVLAPPVTHEAWKRDALTLGFKRVLVTTVNKFRERGAPALPKAPLIVDEWHLLGGSGGEGFKKLDRSAAKHPVLIGASATPRYNKPERCYTLAHTFRPNENRGSYLEWAYKNCDTRPNPFARTPYVDSMLNGESPDAWLARQEYVVYVEDTATWDEDEVKVEIEVDLKPILTLGLDIRKHRILNHYKTEEHALRRYMFLNDLGQLRIQLFSELFAYMEQQDKQKFLVYSWSKEIARALTERFNQVSGGYDAFLMKGDNTPTWNNDLKNAFIKSPYKSVLIGTDTMATGADGIDNVTDHLIVFCDTQDNAKRRQLIGRVLPRGVGNRDTIVTFIEAIAR